MRRLHMPLEQCGIPLRHLVARRDLITKNLQLLDQHRRLHRIKASVQPDPDIVIFVSSLPVHPERPQNRCHFRVIGKNRTTIAVASERL